MRGEIERYYNHHHTENGYTVAPAKTEEIRQGFFSKHGKKLQCIKALPKVIWPNLCVQKNLAGVA